MNYAFYAAVILLALGATWAVERMQEKWVRKQERKEILTRMRELGTRKTPDESLNIDSKH